MNIYYDLHIHSCLSPCGDNDMTPYNLVNMAAIKGLQMIALTDHNSCLNCPAAVAAGRDAGILVIPGMELCTSEEIHVVCLFRSLEKAMDFSSYVRERIPPIHNKEKVFGEQLIMDSADGIIGKEELLLVTASDISITEVTALMREFDGACYPAHIDRKSYSILSVLGEFSASLAFTAAEVSKTGDKEEIGEKYPAVRELLILSNSDAHYLTDISEPEHSIELASISPSALLRKLMHTPE